MYRSLILTTAILCTFISNTIGATRLKTLTTLAAPAAPFQFQIPGSTNQVTIVEASTDFQNWIGIQTNAAGALNVTVTDYQSASLSRRFYRVRTLAAPLQNLAQL